MSRPCPVASASPWFPPPPQSVEATGHTVAFLAELACRVLHQNGALTLSAAAGLLGLPPSVAGDIIDFARRERLAEI